MFLQEYLGKLHRVLGGGGRSGYQPLDSCVIAGEYPMRVCGHGIVPSIVGTCRIDLSSPVQLPWLQCISGRLDPGHWVLRNAVIPWTSFSIPIYLY